MNNCVVIGGEQIKLPDELKGGNYLDIDLAHFKCKPRKKLLSHLVLHETTGNSALRCQNTLLKKGYGVHLILSRQGLITCHNDLTDEVTIHANQLNKTSVGIEIVNPFYPSHSKDDKDRIIDAEWWTHCKPKSDRRYVLPSKEQLNTLDLLIPFLCLELNIPFEFPTRHLNRKQRKIKNWRFRAKPKPGIVAHQDFSKHADGRFPLEYFMDGMQVKSLSYKILNK